MHQELSALGLMDSEIKTYLTALKKGPSTAIKLSEATKLSRPATYTAIEQLTQRGLMSLIQKNKKRFYAAEDPYQLIAYSQRKEKELKEVTSQLKRKLPELKAGMVHKKPLVRSYEGEEGIKAIVETLSQTKPNFVNEMGDLDAIFNVLDLKDLKKLRKVVLNKQVDLKAIFCGQPRSPEPKTAQRYFLPNSQRGFAADILIKDNVVTVMIFKDELHAIIIESKEVADMLHTLFELAVESKRLEKK